MLGEKTGLSLSNHKREGSSILQPAEGQGWAVTRWRAHAKHWEALRPCV